MVEAAQIEATHESVGALVKAYSSLRDEMLLLLKDAGLNDLCEEFARLFPVILMPAQEVIAAWPNTFLEAAARATEAQLGLRKMGGWIQGLIDEQTLEMRLRLEAEEKAKRESKPATGFGS